MGSRSALIALVEEAGVMRTPIILMYVMLGTYSLETYTLTQSIWDLANALMALVAGAGVMRKLILMFLGLTV